MADMELTAKVKIGNPSEGTGILAEFSAFGIDMTDSNGRDTRIEWDHFDELVKGVAAFRAAELAANARAA